MLKIQKKKVIWFSTPFLAVLALVAAVTVNLNQTAQTRAATCGPTTNFITTWKTDNPGTSNATSITIPTVGAGYSYRIDANNDGDFADTVGTYNESTIQTGSATVNFGTAGTYTVGICGTFPRIYVANAGDKEKLLRVDQWGDNQWVSMGYAFYGARNLDVTATDTPNLSAVTDISGMFYDCRSLVGTASFGAWNTGNVANMDVVFAFAKNFNQDISGWNTSSATSMVNMFAGAASFNQPIGGWNTSLVTNMSGMFNFASTFNQPIGNWNTANVTAMNTMFYSAHAFNQPIGGWDTSKVTGMGSMFFDALVFNQPLGSWNTSLVTDMSHMFSGARSFNQPIGNWDTSKVTTMAGMFSGAKSFNQAISGWDTSLVTDMSNMFGGVAYSTIDYDALSSIYIISVTTESMVFNQPIGSWNTASVTNMQNMFISNAAFNQPIGGWDTASVTNMSGMFAGLDYDIAPYNLYSPPAEGIDAVFRSVPMTFNQDISGWDTSSLQNMSLMFLSGPNNELLTYYDLAGYNATIEGPAYQHPFSYSLANWNITSLQPASDPANFFDDSAQFMLTGASLSTSAYDAFLTSWSGQTVQSGVHLGAHNLAYCKAEAARTDLVNNHSWAISDAGRGCFYIVDTGTPGLVAVDATTGEPLDPSGSSTDKDLSRMVRLNYNGLPLAEIMTSFASDLDWSNVTGAIDEAGYRSVVANLTAAPGTVDEHTLYVPKAAAHNAVVICPDALTLDQVTTSCSNASTLTDAANNVSVATVNGKSYWKVSGLTGTGGVSTFVPDAPDTGTALIRALPLVTLAATVGLSALLVIAGYLSGRGKQSSH